MPYLASSPDGARNLRKEGIWFRDPEGRFVLLRGINFGGRSKLPPYLPILPLDVRDLDADGVNRFRIELAAIQPEFDRMKELGFNAVRLLVMWKAIEPTPNGDLEDLLPEGRTYLTLVAEVIDSLYARGIYSILDFHQDIAHEVYGGDGFPDWALAIDEQHEHPRPPADLRDAKWGLHYYDTVFTARDVLVRHTLTLSGKMTLETLN
jgi:endoglycosylceramidase